MSQQTLCNNIQISEDEGGSVQCDVTKSAL